MTVEDIQDLELMIFGIIIGLMLAMLYSTITSWWAVRQMNKIAAEELARDEAQSMSLSEIVRQMAKNEARDPRCDSYGWPDARWHVEDCRCRQ